MTQQREMCTGAPDREHQCVMRADARPASGGAQERSCLSPPLPHGWRCLRRVLPTAQAPAPRLVYRHQPAWAVLGCAGLPGNTGQLGNLETWEPELRPHMPDSQNLVAWCEPDSWTSVPVVIRDTNMCQCTLVVKPAHLTLHSKSYIF